MPAISPLGAVTPRHALQFDVEIPPGVVAIVPPAAPAAPAGILGALETGALSLNVPFEQSQRT